MKLVIDRDRTKPDKPWRWSIISVAGVNVTIHEQGTAANARDAFEAGYAIAVAKFGAEK